MVNGQSPYPVKAFPQTPPLFQKSTTCNIRAPTMPPMMHHIAIDNIASELNPCLVPNLWTKYTATATPTTVKKPCHENRNGPKPKMYGSNGIEMVPRTFRSISPKLSLVLLTGHLTWNYSMY